MIELIMTLAVGIIGGSIALRFKIPAGAMMGSMMAVAVFSIITGDAFMPQNVKIITQIAAGAFVGAGISRKDVLDIKLLIKPAIIMLSIMISLNLFMGYIMYKTTGLDLVTALFATAPGGIVDMALISDDLGADTSKVAILHLVRLISVLVFLPSVIKFMAARSDDTKNKASERVESAVDAVDKLAKATKDIKPKHKAKEEIFNLSLTIVVAFTAGLLGYVLNIPAGTMSFSMVAVGAFNVFTSKGYMPVNLRRLTQMFAGALIGARVTYNDVLALKGIMIPALILLVGVIIVNLIIGFLIYKTSCLELITSLLASAPGGLSDMALIAKDLGADVPKVAILHLVRVVTIIGFFPILIKYIIS